MDKRGWLAFFPFLFVGMWLLISTVLGMWSGWNTLQDECPDRQERPNLRLRFQSGALGSGRLWNPWGNVQYGNCLRLDACPAGLRISLWKISDPSCVRFSSLGMRSPLPNDACWSSKCIG